MNTFKLLDRDELGALASPVRRELLDALVEPDSAVNLARRFEMSRQRVGYHMRELEKAGYIELAGERPQRGLTERFYRARPMAYVHGRSSRHAELRARDRVSWRALTNVLAQALWELMTLRRRADAANKQLATLTLDAEVRFSTPVQRRAFTEDLVDAVETVLKTHDQPDGTRSFRLVLGAYPALKEEDDEHAKTQH